MFHKDLPRARQNRTSQLKIQFKGGWRGRNREIKTEEKVKTCKRKALLYVWSEEKIRHPEKWRGIMKLRSIRTCSGVYFHLCTQTGISMKSQKPRWQTEKQKGCEGEKVEEQGVFGPESTTCI